MTTQPPEELLTELPPGYVEILDRMFTLFEAKGLDLPPLEIPIVAALTLADDNREAEGIAVLLPYCRDTVYRQAVAVLDLYAAAEAEKAKQDRFANMTAEDVEALLQFVATKNSEVADGLRALAAKISPPEFFRSSMAALENSVKDGGR